MTLNNVIMEGLDALPDVDLGHNSSNLSFRNLLFQNYVAKFKSMEMVFQTNEKVSRIISMLESISVETFFIKKTNLRIFLYII